MVTSISGSRFRRWVAPILVSIVSSTLIVAGSPASRAAGIGVVTLAFGASPGLIQWGNRATLSGTLSFADSSSPDGEQVTLEMTPPGGLQGVVDVATLTPAGTFSVSSPILRTPGTYTFTADYPGNVIEAAATTDATTVLTVVKLSSSRRIVDFKQPLRLTVHLDNHRQTGMHRVALYDFPYPKTTATLIGAERVNSNGDATFLVHPGKLTAFVATWAVVSPDLVVSNTIWVRVRAEVVADVDSFITAPNTYTGQRSGAYYLFSQPPCFHGYLTWVGCLHFRALVSPNSRGWNLCFIKQHMSMSGWKTDLATCGVLSRLSRAGVRLIRSEAAGVRRRVMAYFPSNGILARGDSAWVYYEFVTY